VKGQYLKKIIYKDDNGDVEETITYPSGEVFVIDHGPEGYIEDENDKNSKLTFSDLMTILEQKIKQ
jgi:hypothetical protein